MAKKSIKDALEQVELTYQELVEVANDMVNPFVDPINKLVDNLTNINDLSTNEIRNFMIDIAINSYRLGEVKEKASLKSELAEAIRNEIREKQDNLTGKMISQGTTPRRLTDLLGSLCDLTSGSGDKGTPFIYIQGYFDNYTD